MLSSNVAEPETSTAGADTSSHAREENYQDAEELRVSEVDIVYEAIRDEEREGKPPRRANPGVLLFSAEELLTYTSGAQRQGCKR